MAEEVEAVNGSHGIDLAGVRDALVSNSTKRRTAQLHALREQLADQGR